MLLVWILGFSVVGSVGSVAGASLMLAFPERVRRVLIPCLISYATGTLLAAAFLGMIPAALAAKPALAITSTVLGGIILFFLLEKIVLWRHCHDEECMPHHGRAAPLILIGDSFHNFVDGIVIAAAFLTSVPLGIAAATAVVVHEIPQEVGDFAILLDAGYSHRKAILLNGLSAFATVPGALLGFWSLAALQATLPFILAFSAASFIYVATADLIPGLHRTPALRAAIRQMVLLLAGVATIAILRLGH